MIQDIAIVIISRRISTVSGDIRESSYLFQRIAITIQRFNSVLFFRRRP